MLKNKTIAKCPNCGSTSFHIHETLIWKGFVDEDSNNTIDCKHSNSEITFIECSKCNAELTKMKDDENIVFNFD